MWINELKSLLGESKVIIKETVLDRLSKDYYWYSPVLYEALKEKVADCAVAPETVDELKSVVSFAVKQNVPLTARGAGTGNYGQAIPLHGGIIIDLTKLNGILQVSERTVKAQAGTKLGFLEKELRKQGKELRIFPSTYATATVGGFLCGGSGGIGSIRWGGLWDGNVLGVTVMTIEEEPKLLTIEGEEVQNYIHNYGTTGIVTEAILPIEPKQEWGQFIVYFPSFKEAVSFSDQLARDDSIIKRLVSVCEWPIPKHFQPLKKYIRDGESIVMLEVAEEASSVLKSLANDFSGDVGFEIPASSYQKGLKLSDFTWNHATLWAHKHGENLTYLQARFASDLIFQQMDKIRETFGYEVQFHFEYIKSKGEVIPSSLPIVEYRSKERLYEIIDFCESIGVAINNPHTYLLGFGGYNLRMEEILKRKEENDPNHLLNKGKIPLPNKI